MVRATISTTTSYKKNWLMNNYYCNLTLLYCNPGILIFWFLMLLPPVDIVLWCIREDLGRYGEEYADEVDVGPV